MASKVSINEKYDAAVKVIIIVTSVTMCNNLSITPRVTHSGTYGRIHIHLKKISLYVKHKFSKLQTMHQITM